MRDGSVEGTAAPPEPVGAQELSHRLVYALLLPAARVALARGMGSKELARWAELAIYHEARRHGLKSHEVADRLDVSTRKVAELSRRLKENFLLPDTDPGLPRRIEAMLWAGPASASRIKQTFSEVSAAEVDRALDELERAGRVRRVSAGRTERYERVGAESGLAADELVARIDSLDELLGDLADAVSARFGAEGDEAVAGNVDLRALVDDAVSGTTRDGAGTVGDADDDDGDPA